MSPSWRDSFQLKYYLRHRHGRHGNVESEEEKKKITRERNKSTRASKREGRNC